ncbi:MULTISPECIES: helix-turn-helix domain-containing protein [Streptomyces]|uniref:Helix-turn-helix domain-containing protein n=2 Tax=Streptomyces TaxID=1883 RepID=A0ABV9IJ72_9ACTN
MGDYVGRRPEPLDAGNPQHAFALRLRQLRDTAGAAGDTKATCQRAGISPTTYYAWLAGKQLPGRDALERVVKAWGGEVAEWLELRGRTEETLAMLAVQQRALAPLPHPSARFQEVETQERSVLPPGTSAHARLREARELLRILGFLDEAAGERSALVFLSLLNLTPDRDWRQVERPVRQTTDAMQWIGEFYGVHYKPNTREAIRRHTLHEFREKALIVWNPDNPNRPVNSPKWCFQLSDMYFPLIHSYKRKYFWRELADFWGRVGHGFFRGESR